MTFLAATIAGLLMIMGSAFLYYKLDWKAIFLYAVFFITACVISGTSMDIPLLAAPFVLGGIGGYTFKKGKSYAYYILVSSFITAFLFTGFFYYMMAYQNVDFIALLREEIVKLMDAARAPADIKTQFLADFDGSKNELIARIPFSAFLNSLLLASIGFVVMRRFFSRFMDVTAVAGLEYFRLNDYSIFALIAGLALYLLIDEKNYPIVNSAGFNLMLITALCYFIQALGVIKFLLIKRGLPVYILPVAFITLFIMGIWMAFFLFILLAGAGALDVWADFRKITKKSKPET